MRTLRLHKIAAATAAMALTVGLAACNKDVPPPPAPAPKPPVAAAPAPAVPAPAATPAMTPEEALLVALKARYPSVTFSTVTAFQTAGEPIYQVIVGDKFIYTNAKGDYLISEGDLFIAKDGQLVNLTQQNAMAAGVKLFKELPVSQGFKLVYGAGERQAVIFTDPDCPFCRETEQMLLANASNLNATIYILPYPIEDLHPGATARAKHLICAADPAAAWMAWSTQMSTAPQDASVDAEWAKFAATHPATPNCPAAANVDANLAYGRKIGIDRTPTIMFENGMPFFGSITREELEKAWQYVASTSQAQGLGAVAAAPAAAATVTPAAPVAGAPAPATTVTVMQQPNVAPVHPAAPAVARPAAPVAPAAPAPSTTVTVKQQPVAPAPAK